MKKSDKTKRMVAFYLSVALFSVLLPIVLSYSLGYHIDYHRLKIYKTGMIHIDSHPSGATIYINGKKYPDLTPVRIEELRPGIYKIEVKREGFYPWEKDLVVRPAMVTMADHIVLFPVIREMKQLSAHKILDFAISDRNRVYFFAKSGFLQPNMDGTGAQRLSSFSSWPDKIIGKRFSPDGSKLLYFTDSEIFVIYLKAEEGAQRGDEFARVEKVFSSADPVIDVFWYSGLNYLVVVTSKNIKVVEVNGGEVSLYTFNSRPQNLYYDGNNDSIYFTDSPSGKRGEGQDERGSYLYRLDLIEKLFDRLMQLLMKKETGKKNEQRRAP